MLFKTCQIWEPTDTLLLKLLQLQQLLCFNRHHQLPGMDVATKGVYDRHVIASLSGHAFSDCGDPQHPSGHQHSPGAAVQVAGDVPPLQLHVLRVQAPVPELPTGRVMVQPPQAIQAAQPRLAVAEYVATFWQARLQMPAAAET